MKTGDLVKHFGISESTVRRWTKEYEDFFSDNSGRQRSFTKDDFLVIATILELSKENLPATHIKERLRAGFRVEDTTAETIGYTDGRMVPASAVEQIIDATQLRIELEQVTYERDKLFETVQKLEQLVRDQADKYESRLESTRTEKESRIHELQSKIAELERALGRAEGELSFRRELDQRPRSED